MSSILESIAPELLITIYSLCPDLRTILQLSQCSKQINATWYNYMISIYDNYFRNIGHAGVVKIARAYLDPETVTSNLIPKDMQRPYVKDLIATYESTHRICADWASNLHTTPLLECVNEPQKDQTIANNEIIKECSPAEYHRFQSALADVRCLGMMDADVADDTLDSMTLRQIRDLSAVCYYLRSGYNCDQAWFYLSALPAWELNNVDYLVFVAVNEAMEEKAYRLLGKSIVVQLGRPRPTSEHLAYFSLMDQYQNLVTKLPELV